MDAQSAATVLMVRPAQFGFNPQTAASNAFQQPQAHAAPLAQVRAEFDGVAQALADAGVRVLVAADEPLPAKPDAIFPNNWVSFHANAAVVLYPMLAPNRRLERREGIIEQVLREGAFHAARTIDLSYRERQGKFLEGTGSLVLDRPHRIAYACLSPRTDLDVLGEFAQLLDYELVTFDAHDAAQRPIYHTNVLMAVGSAFAVVCAECITAPAHREAVLGTLKASGHEVILISRRQMLSFAANVLELMTPQGPIVALSQTALTSLDAAQAASLARHARLVPVAIPTIERIGGGGVRCMLAEVHLPRRLMS
jgi:hypothetical protein